MKFLPAAGLSVLQVLSTPCFVKPYVGFLCQPPPVNKTWSLSATGCHSNPCRSRVCNNNVTLKIKRMESLRAMLSFLSEAMNYKRIASQFAATQRDAIRCNSANIEFIQFSCIFETHETRMASVK